MTNIQTIKFILVANFKRKKYLPGLRFEPRSLALCAGAPLTEPPKFDPGTGENFFL